MWTIENMSARAEARTLKAALRKFNSNVYTETCRITLTLKGSVVRVWTTESNEGPDSIFTLMDEMER